jgi:hypothetical protein
VGVSTPYCLNLRRNRLILVEKKYIIITIQIDQIKEYYRQHRSIVFVQNCFKFRVEFVTAFEEQSALEKKNKNVTMYKVEKKT